jgi:hypothetical protein
MPEQRLRIQRSLLTNHFAKEFHRQTLHPRRGRLLAVDHAELLPPAEVKESGLQNAAVKTGYWSLASDLQ